MRRFTRLGSPTVALGAALALMVAAGPAQAAGPRTTLVSRGSDGIQQNGWASFSAINADGNVIAFDSSATNLSEYDNLANLDIYVRDISTGTTAFASSSYFGGPTDGDSYQPALSGSGRYVAFTSTARLLVHGDTNDRRDVFVRDLARGTTERISVSSSGQQGNGDSEMPAISADGRYVVFTSSATNLVPSDGNDANDIFLRDRVAGTTIRVSLTDAGTEANDFSIYPAISDDGTIVSFSSMADNLTVGDANGSIDVFVRDLTAGRTERVSVANDGSASTSHATRSDLSADGRYVAFDVFDDLDDSNGVGDVYVRDRVTRTTRIVSVGSGGTPGNGMSSWPSISADGRRVSFDSLASNLVRGDVNQSWDVFVHDLLTGLTTRASVSSLGTQSVGYTVFNAIAANGNAVAFSSNAPTLVVPDTNLNTDIFRRTLA